MSDFSPLSFRQDWVEWVFARRTEPFSTVFQAFNFLGELEGYVLVVSFVHAAWDKRLAFRLTVVALATMLLNHALKTLLANPRPFVADGTWTTRWAVPPERAAELVAEYSTPSGHAMTGSSFYLFLAASVRRPALWGTALLCILLTGLARPYLGVHFFEDVWLGWGVGTLIALAALRIGSPIAEWWNRHRIAVRTGLALAASAALWTATRLHYAGDPHGPPVALLDQLGLLAGAVTAYPLERRHVDFDPRSLGWRSRIVRFGVTVALVAGAIVSLDWVFDRIAPGDSLLAEALRFLRYWLAAFVGFLGCPILFVRVGLAVRSPRAEPENGERGSLVRKSRLSAR